jgi:hypothetical protein
MFHVNNGGICRNECYSGGGKRVSILLPFILTKHTVYDVTWARFAEDLTT